MLSKCIKMPKYSFRRNLFFCHKCLWLILVYPPHLTCITSATPRIMLAAPCTAHLVGHTMYCVGCIKHRVSCTEKETRNIWSTSFSKFVFWNFLGWKNKFSKTAQNCLKIILEKKRKIMENSIIGGWVSKGHFPHSIFFGSKWPKNQQRCLLRQKSTEMFVEIDYKFYLKFKL